MSRPIAILLVFLCCASGALAQESPIATDRPGFLFSSLTAGRGGVQAELGLPAVTLFDGTDTRTTSLIGLLRVGVGDDFELRLGSPFFNEVRVEAGGRSASDRGYGDLEVGLKWHVLDNKGAQPSFALIPSVIVPAGENGFSVEDPVYQLNTATEWTLADGWVVGLLAGFLRGAGDGHYQVDVNFDRGLTDESPDWLLGLGLGVRF